MQVSNRNAEEPAVSNRVAKTWISRFWRASGLLLSLAGVACTQSEDAGPPVAQPSLEVAYAQEGETLSVRSGGASLLSVLEEAGAKAGFRVIALDSAELNAPVTVEIEHAPVHEVVERLLLGFNKVLTFSTGPEPEEVRLASVTVLRPGREGRIPESVDGATALLRAIDEGDSDARQHLVEQLQEPGNEEEWARATDALAGSLDERQSRGYFDAVKTLDALDRERAALELEKRLKDEADEAEEARQRVMAARGLGLIGSTSSVPALEEATTSDDPALRVAANKSLELISCASSPGGCGTTSGVDRTLHGDARPELP